MSHSYDLSHGIGGGVRVRTADDPRYLNIADCTIKAEGHGVWTESHRFGGLPAAAFVRYLPSHGPRVVVIVVMVAVL